MRPLSKFENLAVEIRQKSVKMAILDFARCDGVAYLNFQAAETLVQVSQVMFDDVLAILKLELAASQRETKDSGDCAPWGCHQKIGPCDMPCKYHYNYEPDEDYRQALKQFISILELHRKKRMANGQSFDFMIMTFRTAIRDRERDQALEQCEAHRLAAMKLEHKLFESLNIGGHKFNELKQHAANADFKAKVKFFIACVALEIPGYPTRVTFGVLRDGLTFAGVWAAKTAMDRTNVLYGKLKAPPF